MAVLKVKDGNTWVEIPALQGEQGPQGIQGIQGVAGQNGQDGNDGITPTITITNITGGHNVAFSYGSGDSRNVNFDVLDGQDGNDGQNGTNGQDGNDGQDGQDGNDGQDGITPTVTVTTITGGHNVAFYYGLGDSRNVDFDIMDGQDGQDGQDGTNGINGQDGTNGNDGQDGQDGSDGNDGITPTVTITSITGGHNIAFTYGVDDPRNTNFDVMDGSDGQDGSDGTNGTNGQDGIAPSVSVSSITGGHQVSFDYGTGDSRNTSFNVMDGATGQTGPAGTYTAGNNIAIDNGEISVSDLLRFEDDSGVSTEIDWSGLFVNATSQQDENEFETFQVGFTPVALEFGKVVKDDQGEVQEDLIVDLMYNFDDGVFEYDTGELDENDDPIIKTIATLDDIPSGGGTTYTAGHGIDINNNNVISTVPYLAILNALNTTNSLTLYNVETSLWQSTLNDAANELKTKGLTIFDASSVYGFSTSDLNTAMGGTSYKCQRVSYTTSTGVGTGTLYNSTDTTTLFSRNNSNMWAFVIAGDRLLYAQSFNELKNALGFVLVGSLRLANNTNSYNIIKNDIVLTTALQHLDEAIYALQTKVPAPPTTDGTYTLQCTVSSGTPTYSWV